MVETKLIAVPDTAQLNDDSQQILSQVKAKLGVVPNLFATIGYSSSTLSSFFNFKDTAGIGSFTDAEVEVIKLAVSQANNCSYCLAAHTLIAKSVGFTEEETLQIRSLTISNPKQKAIAEFAFEIAKKAGHASDELVQSFLDAGHDEKALIDLIAIVTVISFTNYVHGVTKVPVDFPEVSNI